MGPPPHILSPGVTSQVGEAGPFGAPEDDAGDQDESGDQQEGEEIEQHQEPQQHKEGLDAAAEVSCGTKVLFYRPTACEKEEKRIDLQSGSRSHLQSTATLFSTVRKNRGFP